MNAHSLARTLSRQNNSTNLQKPCKSAQKMHEIQQHNKLAQQIGKLCQIRPPISGGGRVVSVCTMVYLTKGSKLDPGQTPSILSEA